MTYQQQPYNQSQPPNPYSAPFVPAPASTRRPIPALHLIGAVLLSLGLMFVAIGVREVFVQFGNAFSGAEGSGGAEALLWLGFLAILGGIITGGVGRWLDSQALKNRFSV